MTWKPFGSAAALVSLTLAVVSCDLLEDLTGVEEEDGEYGFVEIYDKTSFTWTDRLPARVVFTDRETHSEGAGIGAGGSSPTEGIAVVVANVDPASPCARVGQTCVAAQGSPTMVQLTLVSPGEGIAHWVAVGGEVTVESINPTRFRLENVQMRVAPYSANPANGSFNLRGRVGVGADAD